MNKFLSIVLSMLVLMLLGACTVPGMPGTGGPTAQEEPNASPYQLLIASSDVTAEDNRVALTFWDGPERFTGGQDVTARRRRREFPQRRAAAAGEFFFSADRAVRLLQHGVPQQRLHSEVFAPSRPGPSVDGEVTE